MCCWRHPPCYWPWTQPPSLPPTHLGYTRVGVASQLATPCALKHSRWSPMKPRSVVVVRRRNILVVGIILDRYTLIDEFDRWLMACHHSTINIVARTKSNINSHHAFNGLCTHKFVSVCFIGLPIKVGGIILTPSKPSVGANV